MLTLWQHFLKNAFPISSKDSYKSSETVVAIMEVEKKEAEELHKFIWHKSKGNRNVYRMKKMKNIAIIMNKPLVK